MRCNKEVCACYPNTPKPADKVPELPCEVVPEPPYVMADPARVTLYDSSWYQAVEVPVDVETVLVKQLENFVALPEYKSEGAAAMDLYSAEDITIFPGNIAMVSTGIAIALPQGYEAQIRARSGVASKGIIVLNAPGTIDEDYRGEIKVLLANLGLNDAKHNPSSPYKIKKGDRIAQMVVARVTKAHLRVVEELDETERGEGGFGSTGISN